MPPKKKQKKENGFMVFMKSMKPQLEAKGHRFPRGFLDVISVCSPLWNELSSEEKAKYHQKAKDGDGLVKEERCDTRGVPLNLKAKEEQKKVSEKDELLQRVEDMVSYLATQGTLENHYFYLAHFNIAVATSEGEYPPCEISIVKFSLLDGIARYYHEFIEPGQIRLGYANEAKIHSESTHQIPTNGFKLANANYVAIVDNIKKMLLQSDGGIAPLFVVDEDKVKAVYILDWLVKKCCQMNETYDTVNPFKCYSLNKLFYELRRHADLNNPSLMFASPALVADHFGKGMFYYSKNMACQWHVDEDNVTFCSLTRVKNYAYTISDLCCENYDLSLLPNRHCPADVADDNRYVVLPKVVKKEEPETPAVVKKNDDEEESTLPRKPRAPAALTLKGVVPGIGRGILSGSMSSIQSPGPSQATSTPPPPAGRGRGRGLLLLDESN
ncbi:protein maelstrom homolog [Daphnia magna]|uniref:protein maelstrom homolog n=1 Tax=Daphnia magna TaxID=35525 RepID=UPI001402F866|nr:protein maelstrom homolog [Daphnia magna]